MPATAVARRIAKCRSIVCLLGVERTTCCGIDDRARAASAPSVLIQTEHPAVFRAPAESNGCADRGGLRRVRLDDDVAHLVHGDAQAKMIAEVDRLGQRAVQSA